MIVDAPQTPKRRARAASARPPTRAKVRPPNYARQLVERRLAALKAELGVGAGQGNGWKKFAASFRMNARRMRQRHRSVQATPPRQAPGAIDALEQMFGTLEERLAALEALRRGATALYVVLTPAQRKKADRLIPACCIAHLWSNEHGDFHPIRR